MSAVPSPPMPRSTTSFRRGLGTHEVLDGLADLIRTQGGVAVSVRAFNEARGALVPPLPSAQAICARLGVPWPRVRELALLNAPERAQALGHQLAASHPNTPDDALLLRVLRAAAMSTGQPLAGDGYDRLRPQLERSLAQSACTLDLPHSATLVARFGSWDAVLTWAGLEVPTGGLPAPKRARPAVELLDEFIDEYGLIPPSSWFPEWCRLNGIPRGRDARRWTQVVADTRAAREARGAETPDRLARLEELPPLPTPGAPQRLVPEGPHGGYSREQVLVSLRRYASEHLPASGRATWRHYRSCATGDAFMVPGGCLSPHGRFQDLCREAGV